jgi:hypothetical protein
MLIRYANQVCDTVSATITVHPSINRARRQMRALQGKDKQLVAPTSKLFATLRRTCAPDVKSYRTIESRAT